VISVTCGLRSRLLMILWRFLPELDILSWTLQVDVLASPAVCIGYYNCVIVIKDYAFAFK
jgi:hypothetical protein